MKSSENAPFVFGKLATRIYCFIDSLLAADRLEFAGSRKLYKISYKKLLDGFDSLFFILKIICIATFRSLDLVLCDCSIIIYKQSYFLIFYLHSDFYVVFHVLDSFFLISHSDHNSPYLHDGSVVMIPDFVMRYVLRYLGHDAIRIVILVYRVSQFLDLQFVYDGYAIYRPRYTLLNHLNRCRMCWTLAVA